MPSRRLSTALAATVFALLALLPATVLAADGPDVTGTVVLDGAPVANANVSVLVEGSDMVWPATTDASGSWAVTTGVAVGQTLTISAVGPTTRSEPDERGCITDTTMSGRVQVAVEALPIDPVTVTLDTPVSSTVCGATATPVARPTPPATDAAARPAAAGSGALPLLVGLAALVLLTAAPAARRSTRRP